ncbi:MAG TPA: XdhC family protein [Candidatus Binataceae bacterium]|nr:XdhC family protein [Candidatus Binataceae bacterium]
MTNPDQIWAEAVRVLQGGKPFVLATVVNVRGSTPREVGAKMIVRDDGQFGTIGGGCGEAEVFRKARVLLEDETEARLAEVDLTGDFDQQEIGTCGGIMDVFIDRWSPEADLPLAKKLADAAERNRPAALLTVVDPGADGVRVGSRTVVDPAKREVAVLAPVGLEAFALEQVAERAADSHAGLVEVGETGLKHTTRIAPNGAPRIFIDPIAGAQRLIIVGAGHIAQPLASMGSMLGFHVTVIDDRHQFANRERFPTANEIIVKPFRDAIESLGLDKHCFLVSVTRGHAYDEEAVEAALRQPCGFVGMIGSRRRVKTTLDRLIEAGIPREHAEQVHAPLGLDLGAETPEEIAIAILAEIVRERRTGVRDVLTMGVKLGRLKSTI